MKLTLAVAMAMFYLALCMPLAHAGTRETVNVEDADQGDESEPVDAPQVEEDLPSEDGTAQDEAASASDEESSDEEADDFDEEAEDEES